MKLKDFVGSMIVAVIGLAIGFGIGYEYSGTLAGAFSAMFLTLILAILEVSLSFDNAVVNASVLREMTPIWRHRFLTWGIIIAVFGMRIVFPIAIVSIIGHLDPWSALVLAATNPTRYAEIMLSSHVALAGFGGSFLLMVALGYFFNASKEVHWVHWLEYRLAKLGKIEAIELGLCLALFYMMSRFIHDQNEQLTLLVSGIAGLITYIFIDGISSVLKFSESGKRDIEKASVAMFLYLEILDASFSFDGVIGAFALTNNIFIIAAGLGIGAMFVRSLTVWLVEHETLEEFLYLEHGAFYAIGALALMMLGGVFIEIPEVVTGLIGAVIIGLAFFSSIRHERGRRI